MISSLAIRRRTAESDAISIFSQLNETTPFPRILESESGENAVRCMHSAYVHTHLSFELVYEYRGAVDVDTLLQLLPVMKGI